MKTIDLTQAAPSLNDLLEMARRENLVLKTEGGKEFLPTEVDDFDEEVRRTRENSKLMALVDEAVKDPQRYSHEQIKQELNIT